MMETHPLDNYIHLKIKEVLEESKPNIAKEDIQDIIDNLIPLIDEIISKKIKQHLLILIEYMIKILNLKETSEDAKNSKLQKLL